MKNILNAPCEISIGQQWLFFKYEWIGYIKLCSKFCIYAYSKIITNISLKKMKVLSLFPHVIGLNRALLFKILEKNNNDTKFYDK